MFELFLIALALAMDAFAVALGKGLALGPRANAARGITIGAWFGIFQGLMPLIGWALASLFATQIQAFDHWIAFILLAAIGAKMIWDGTHPGDEEHTDDMSARSLFWLAVATSIDALAAGVSFALTATPIVPAVVMIAVVTFLLSGIGVRLGSRLGEKWGNWAEIVGGIVLVAMGLKILLEHLIG